MKPQFTPGKNIAMKVPSHEFEQTVFFYRNILGFQEVGVKPPNNSCSVVFEFGDKNLWIDKVSTISQAELWLEIVTENVELASKYFEENGCIRRDEIEPLSSGFKGFWISNPSNIIHLINQ